jgi:hypothetical protein
VSMQGMIKGASPYVSWDETCLTALSPAVSPERCSHHSIPQLTGAFTRRCFLF